MYPFSSTDTDFRLTPYYSLIRSISQIVSAREFIKEERGGQRSSPVRNGLSIGKIGFRILDLVEIANMADPLVMVVGQKKKVSVLR